MTLGELGDETRHPARIVHGHVAERVVPEDRLIRHDPERCALPAAAIDDGRLRERPRKIVHQALGVDSVVVGPSQTVSQIADDVPDAGAVALDFFVQHRVEAPELLGFLKLEAVAPESDLRLRRREPRTETAGGRGHGEPRGPETRDPALRLDHDFKVIVR